MRGKSNLRAQNQIFQDLPEAEYGGTKGADYILSDDYSFGLIFAFKEGYEITAFDFPGVCELETANCLPECIWFL